MVPTGVAPGWAVPERQGLVEGTWKTVCPEDKGLWGGLGLAREKAEEFCQTGCITLWPFCHGIPSAKIVQITLVDNKSVDDSLILSSE